MKIAPVLLLFLLAGCGNNRQDIEEKKGRINTQIQALYKEYTRLSDSEMHIMRPLQIPADTIHFMDSLAGIIDPVLEKMEINIWMKIRKLKYSYDSLEN